MNIQTNLLNCIVFKFKQFFKQLNEILIWHWKFLNRAIKNNLINNF